MYQFPKDLYADVRIEENYNLWLGVKNGDLDSDGSTKEAGAFIRVFDGTMWYTGTTNKLDEKINKSLPHQKCGRLFEFSSDCDVCNGVLDHLLQIVRSHLNLIANLACAEHHGVAKQDGFIHDGGKGFFHTDGGAAAVDINRQGEKFPLRDHGDGFLARRARSSLEIKLRGGRDYKDMQCL